MRDFAGRVAVVTGAASGISRGLAERFARGGMQVVLADVQADALDATVGEEGHVVNTSSVHGLYAGRGAPTYAASKCAVTRITEGLFYDLAARDSRVKCSLLCPGEVATDLDLAARNRPAAFHDQLSPAREAEIDRLSRHRYDRHQVEGISPVAVAGLVVDGIREERFYLLTHPEIILSRVRLRMEAILAGANPPVMV